MVEAVHAPSFRPFAFQWNREGERRPPVYQPAKLRASASAGDASIGSNARIRWLR